MKKLNILGILMILASSFLFVQCTHDDPYIGADGIDGIDGINGVNGEFVCISCHNTSHRDSVTAAYNLSLHSIQTVMFNGQNLAEFTNRTSCAQCHTSQGYIEYIETGAVQDTVPLPIGVTCTTCHGNHLTFDFVADGADYALRNIEPLELIVDQSYGVDYDNSSNSCISCHQPRRPAPLDDGSGLFTITTVHWGPHHGPQATMLDGIQGAELAGSMSYPADASAAHRAGSSCTACHMAETTNGSDGSHSMLPVSTVCVACHAGGVPTEVSGLAADLDMLEILLENVVSQDGTVTGIIHDGHPQEGTFTATEAMAAWNYLFVIEDSSDGIHNPDYAKALIRNSVEALE